MMTSLVAAVLLFVQDPPSRSGIEVTRLNLDTTLVENVALSRVTVEVRNWDMTSREADFRFDAPPSAIIAEARSSGGVTPDVQAGLLSSDARKLVDKLRAEAAKTAPTGTVTTKTDQMEDTEKGFTGWVSINDASTTTAQQAPPRKAKDPTLIEKTGSGTFRVRLYPILPANEARTYTKSPEGTVLNPMNPDKDRSAGKVQKIEFLVVHTMKKAGDDWIYEFPLRFSGDVGKLPKMTTQGHIVSCAGYDLKEGKLDKEEHVVSGGGAAPLRFKVHYEKDHTLSSAQVIPEETGGHGGEHAGVLRPIVPPCATDSKNKMQWVLKCLGAADDADMAVQMHLVTGKTSMVLADTALYEKAGEGVPQGATPTTDGDKKP